MVMVIGTRGSRLALAQSQWVAAKMAERGLASRLEIIKTKGDVVMDRFDKMEGKGFFTSELENALLQGRIDLAVHSLKDLPTTDTEGLTIKAIPKRENPFDVFIANQPFSFGEDGIPHLAGLRVGTSSNRRIACIAADNPQAHFVPIRGNVPTRLAKLERDEADVLVLARAGLSRLNIDLALFHHFEAEPPQMVPAPGQGALGIQTRFQDAPDLNFLHHAPTARCVNAERRILNILEGGCQLPLGVLIREAGDAFVLDLFRGFADPERTPVRLSMRDASPERLADEAIDRLLATRP